MAECGTTTKYRNGCRCDDCTRANRIRVQRHRAKHVRTPPTPAPASNVVSIGQKHPTAQPTTSTPQDAMGRNELAVIQLFERRDPDGDFAVQCEQARVMARILDNRDYAPMHAAALKAQNESLKCLEAKRKKMSGRIVAISSMTAKARAQ